MPPLFVFFFDKLLHDGYGVPVQPMLTFVEALARMPGKMDVEIWALWPSFDQERLDEWLAEHLDPVARPAIRTRLSLNVQELLNHAPRQPSLVFVPAHHDIVHNALRARGVEVCLFESPQG